MTLQNLLKPVNDAELSRLLDEARAVTLQRFGSVVQLYAPLYLSNECVDTCTYCGFSRMNKIPRRTLSVGEVLAETDHLIAQGFRHVLYVAGEHPKHVSPEYLENILRAVRPGLSSVSLEVAPFTSAVYKRLIESGLDGIVLYQETYDSKKYAAYHLGGPKRSFEGRLNFAEEAAGAGIRHLGLGILLGLADWKEDAAALVAHLQRLRKNYWRTELTISLPRLRPCASEFEPPHPVSEREFLQLIAALRLTLPDVGLVLSTRESPELRDRLIGLGVTRMSAGSRTEPGGYLHPDETLKQFEIEDRRTPEEMASVIREKGYEPVWKDWEKIA